MNRESNNSEILVLRDGTPKDVDLIRQLVHKYGTTQWSSFPQEDLETHLIKISAGTHHALLAFSGNELVGMVSFASGEFYLKYEPEMSRHESTGYIVEALVHPDFTKRGIATRLLARAIETLTDAGVNSIYAKRHEQNKSSEALLRKNGFQVIDVYPDARRTSGTGRTVVEKFSNKS